jgi:NAD-dependent dihydropyrimidine dehydrogenase PreA subunit
LSYLERVLFLEHFMTQFNDRPIPLIDPQLCDGCGLCVCACPTKALALREGLAIVANPLACEYSGLCEAICPTRAITRPFEIVVAEGKRAVPDGQTDSVGQENLLDSLDPVQAGAAHSM